MCRRMPQENTYYSDDEYEWLKQKEDERNQSFSSIVREAVRRDMQRDMEDQR